MRIVPGAPRVPRLTSRRSWRRGLVAAGMAGLFAAAAAQLTLAAPPSAVITGDSPAMVASGAAVLVGHHDSTAVLDLRIGLGVHNSAALDALIRAARNGGSAGHAHYLTNAEYLATYAPTRGEVAAVTAWLSSFGISVGASSPDNLLVHASATVAQAEAAFGVVINDYRAGGRTFFGNDRDPSVPASLNIHWVSGLANDVVYAPTITGGGLDGGDLRKAYDVVGDGKGQTVGFTLWGASLPQSDYDGYATASGSPKLVVGQAGDDGLDFIAVDGAGSSATATDSEIALDTQNAHTVAPGIHETYWLGKDNTNGTLEDVLSAAANSSVTIVSNSWGAQANPCVVDGNMETALQHGAATGKQFYFSTGDAGASTGCEYPASSQYVLAVGGTSLSVDANSNYSSESAVNNGGGCLQTETRPTWQTGIGAAYVWGSSSLCTGRATPDVSAISGFCTDGSNCGPGTYVYFDGSGVCCYGGTSLATPVWAAAHAVWNNSNAGSGRAAPGLSAPILYALANDPTTYARDFHDVTSGTNGYAAAKGWDEATGWGSADFDKLHNNLADVTYTGPTQVHKGQAITLSATLYDHGTSSTIATSILHTETVSLAAAGSSCDATVDATGHASCSVTVNDDPGTYKAIAAFAGDEAYKGTSSTVDFIVLGIPTKLVYTGATTGDYNDTVTLSGTLTDASNPTSFSSGDPIPNESVAFTFGATSCAATTDASGVASCQVTPLDAPAGLPYTITASFGGDSPVYNGTSDASASFTVTKEESAVASTGSLTSHYHDVVTLAASLTDPVDKTPIAGKTVSFKLGTGAAAQTCSGTSSSTGAVTCSLTPSLTGSQPLAVTFAGDSDYVSSSDAETFSITPEETTMAYTGPTLILAGAQGATLTATLREDGTGDSDADGGSAAPSPAETVTLSVGGQSCSAASNAAGNVTCTIPKVTVPLGPQTVGASFSGDAYYAASSASTTAIVFAFPSVGVFSLGDVSVAAAGPTTAMTWWSNNWYLANNLSGGPAPSAFKGFIGGTITLPSTTPASTCGGSWTSLGGNSASPPATVPSYMGVVVVTNVAKAPGNKVTGKYVQVVVVKTAPGYAPGPNNVGSGTIVGVFCHS